MLNRHAVFSPDRKKRYQLHRVWQAKGPLILFIMYNPSQADEQQDDPTLRRVMRFAQDWGYGGLMVGNLYPQVNSNPAAVNTTTRPQKENYLHLKTMIAKAQRVVYAWGMGHEVPTWLSRLVNEPYVLGLSKKGVPRHPLYLKATTQPEPYLASGKEGDL